MLNEHKYEDLDAILNQHRSDLYHLHDFTKAVEGVIEKYRKMKTITLPEIIEAVPSSNNPSIRFREFVKRKTRNKWLKNSQRLNAS